MSVLDSLVRFVRFSVWIGMDGGFVFAYHGGKGSEARIWDWREAREVVRWARRWRVCSRALTVRGGSVDGGFWAVVDIIWGGDRAVQERN